MMYVVDDVIVAVRARDLAEAIDLMERAAANLDRSASHDPLADALRGAAGSLRYPSVPVPIPA